MKKLSKKRLAIASETVLTISDLRHVHAGLSTLRSLVIVCGSPPATLGDGPSDRC